MIKSSLFVLMAWLSVSAYAQQLPLFTQYRENLGIINPAAVSSDFFLYNQPTTLGISYRKQWAGLDAAPTTQVIRAEHFNAYSGNNAAPTFGGYFMNDRTGPLGMTGLYGKVGVVLSSEPEEYGISAGLSAGAVMHHIDPSKIIVRDNNDISISDRQNQIVPDVGLGIYAWQKFGGRGFFDNDIIAGGLSVPQVLGLNLAYKDANGQFNIKRVQHYYGQVSLIHKFNNDEQFLEPSVWIKYTPNAPVNVDFNLRYQIITNLWVGTGMSTAGNFHAETGFSIGDDAGLDGNLKIGYGFDYSYSAAGPFFGSTHEFNVTYSFGGK
jgi:type IX secretion system PorP/SprF family membrane protein